MKLHSGTSLVWGTGPTDEREDTGTRKGEDAEGREDLRTLWTLHS